MRSHYHSVILCLTAVICLATNARAQSSNRSRTINAGEVFTFRLPVDFKQSETGVDSFMRGYQRGHARFIFVCGDTASFEYNEKNMRDLREETVAIDGKPATIRTFLYQFERAALYITELNVGDWRNGKAELYMSMDSPDRADSETAKQIFRSVRFLKPGCS